MKILKHQLKIISDKAANFITLGLYDYLRAVAPQFYCPVCGKSIYDGDSTCECGSVFKHGFIVKKGDKQ
ncbi:MAG: hypothetical protein LBK53_09285 [Heliobacteriaceae bacterium]|jgi:hypothetical protein|nr:hypothetical protein [Heliobacteriaceae bacterium]